MMTDKDMRIDGRLDPPTDARMCPRIGSDHRNSHDDGLCHGDECILFPHEPASFSVNRRRSGGG